MKICRFGAGRYGVVKGDTVIDITAVVDRLVPLTRVPFRGDPVVAKLAEIRAAIQDGRAVDGLPALPLATVDLLSPVASPSKLPSAPKNYHAHVQEMEADTNRPRREGPSLDIEEAGLFLKANSALVGPSEGVTLRFPDRRNDHEVELVAIIGRPASNVAEGDALSHVAGYTIGLDMTLRGKEDRSFRKSIDGYAVAGPWMVTADEIADPNDLKLSLSVNGETRQSIDTGNMILNVAKLIAFGSRFYTLLPGDLLFTGTGKGVGSVKPGDVMVAHCSGIGSMSVKVNGYA
ncbi:MAG TPA: fumarylacetoacetate hydrolase family protein [Stellaceae bacterium]|jgi:2-keto-4-pentenoate hydratase/2-oxohepta-3-ene-1,7-dioic acid hydratase in catechol pathway|nr:fumarylacetoacetate hydrolase family protein [Stellaceae bacterium]